MLFKNIKTLRPNKTKIQPRGGYKYVYVVVDKKYNPGKKNYTEKRVCIGRMIDDQYMEINDVFAQYYPDAELIEVHKKIENKKSKVVKIGATTILKKIYEELKLDTYIKNTFSKGDGLEIDISNTIFNLACYMIINETAAFQYYPHFARNHYVMKSSVINDVDISRFIKEEISDKENILNFNRTWFENNVNNDNVYLSIDGTNINFEAEGVTLCEMGNAKDDETKPVIGLTYAYNHTNARPLAYDIYKGSIVDMSQIQEFLKKLNDFGLYKVSLILDRGYFSKSNIDLIMKECKGFIMMTKDNSKIIKEKIIEARTIINDVRYYLPEYELYGLTIKGKLFKQDLDGEERYFHIYFDEERKVKQKKNLFSEIKELVKAEEKWIDKKYDEEKHNKKVIRYILDEKDIIKNIEINEEYVNEIISNYGYFCIVSSMELTPLEALRIYRNRDEIEKVYRILKTHLEMDKIRVHSNASVRGKFFITFIASILRNELLQKIKKQKILDSKNNTVPAVLQELDDVEAIINSKDHYVLDASLTSKQKKINNSFNINTSFYSKILNELSNY